MDKISELKQQRAALVVEMRSILDAADAEKRTALTAEEQPNYDRLETAVDDYGSRITTEEGLRSREIELASRESQIDPRSAQGDASAVSAALARFLSEARRPRWVRDHAVMRGAVEALAHREPTPAEKRPTRDLDADVAAYFGEHPSASANDATKALGGRRGDVLAAARRFKKVVPAQGEPALAASEPPRRETTEARLA